jgi:hypothetical protein
MCSGRGTSDADKNRALPSVALQQESLCTLKDRPDENMARVPKMSRGKIFGHAAFIVVPFYFFHPATISILWGTCAYIHISDSVEFIHELQLLLNSTANEMFLHKLGAVRRVDWMFIFGCRSGGYLADMWHWTKRFTIFVSNRT